MWESWFILLGFQCHREIENRMMGCKWYYFRRSSFIIGACQRNGKFWLKKILYTFGCINCENTVRRLKWVTALKVDVKQLMLCLVRELDNGNNREMVSLFLTLSSLGNEGIFWSKKHIDIVEKSTDWEGFYGKAI